MRSACVSHAQVTITKKLDMWKLVISCHPPGWWQVALDPCLRHTWNTSGNLQNQAFYCKWNADRTGFHSKFRNKKNPTKLDHPWAILSPPGSTFKFFFHFACMAALIKTASQFWCCAAQLSGMEWHVSLTLNRLSWLGFHELFRGHMHTPMYSYTFTAHYMHLPPLKKKKMVHFWDFAPGENGKKQTQ